MPLKRKMFFAGGLLVAVIFLGVVFSIISGDTLERARVVAGGRVIAVEIADTKEERARGLSFRRSIGPSEGMLFLFDSPGRYGFWMKDMNFAIDIIWIRGDRVVGIVENATPEPDKNTPEFPIYYPPGDVDKVLEVAARRAAFLGLTPGNLIKIEGL